MATIDNDQITNPDGKVLFDKILVYRFEKADPISTSVIIPEAHQEKPRAGVVLKVGEGRISGGYLIGPRVQPGNIVHFGEYCGVTITLNNKDYLILREDEILFVEPGDVAEEIPTDDIETADA